MSLTIPPCAPLHFGIFCFSWLAEKARWAQLPEGVTWNLLPGGGMLGGIGFTMAIFIAGLALEGDLLNHAKIGIMVGSLLSAVFGMMLIFLCGRKQKAAATEKMVS